MTVDLSTTSDQTDSAGALAGQRSGAWDSLRAAAAEGWLRLEALLERAGDYLNPILVKETRQAIKSRQFAMTFILVLICCWVVTIGGVAIIGPTIFYSAWGAQMLIAYYFILAFPLIVVVPYSAYRSLAAEREDNTYELLSISTLSPHQIIAGKLGSAIVQMTVYLSAIAPCLAFTYLLRGVDVPTIVTILVYTFLGSLGLSMAGILSATLAKNRYGQVVSSVGIIIMLLFAFTNAVTLIIGFLSTGVFGMGNELFWTINGALATAYFTTFLLAFLAASAMISFSSANRSTPLRAAMLVQQAAFLGWMGWWWWYRDFTVEAVFIAVIWAGVYWFIAGTMLTGERSGMSRRVKRSLPQTFIGRMLFTWLNPGPATGYYFVVANITAVGLLGLGAVCASHVLNGNTTAGPGSDTIVCVLLVIWGYVVAYLGVGMLLIKLLRRVTEVTVMAGSLIHFLLIVMFGSGIPFIIQMSSTMLRDQSYNLIQLSNPFWSVSHLIDTNGISSEAEVILFVVPVVGACVVLSALGTVVRELRHVRVAQPARVVEDEAELHPAPPPEPTSPWDE